MLYLSFLLVLLFHQSTFVVTLVFRWKRKVEAIFAYTFIGASSKAKPRYDFTLKKKERKMSECIQCTNVFQGNLCCRKSPHSGDSVLTENDDKFWDKRDGHVLYELTVVIQAILVLSNVLAYSLFFLIHMHARSHTLLQPSPINNRRKIVVFCEIFKRLRAMFLYEL